MSVLPFDVNSFLEKHKAALTPEEIAGMDELRKGYLRNDDYQRNSNKLKQEYQTAFSENEEYAQRLKTWETEAAEAIRVKQLVEKQYGSIDKFVSTADPAILRTPSGDLVARTDVEKIVNDFNAKINAVKQEFHNFAEGTYHMVVKMPSYTRQFEDRYKEPFDGKAFMDFLDQNNISNPDIGYQLYTADKEKTFLENKHKDDLAAARAEGERSAVSKYHLPETAGRPPLRTPLTMPLKPVTQSAPAPAAPSTTVAPPPTPTVVPTRSAADVANDVTGDLRSRMQNNFLKVKDQP